MPIRFRCPGCNQLMGIARRKAGTTVNCTACHSPVTVPAEDDAPLTAPGAVPIPDSSPPPPPLPPRDVFDRDDFDVILHREPAARAPAVATPPPPVREPRPDESLMLPPQPAPAAGVVLSPGWATVLTVVLVLLLALSFVAGVLVGRFAL
jgi:hypothetical protein